MDLRNQLQSSLGTAYAIERELGGGGMSRVFVARDATLKRRVVVKVLAPDLAGGVSSERFAREIELAAQLQHPNIVPLLSAGEADGLPFYTMPLVDGESLRARIERAGELPVREAVSILRDVARALSYAHARGVVHRDIKPDNVLLAHDYAVVTDFGVAKALTAARTEPDPQAATLTQLGTALGTPAYMAPEQAAGDPATDRRADIYAFGAMAYEVLTGVPPFAARTPQALFAAHAAERPVALAQRRTLVPSPLADLVMRCLEKRPADRPQSADELVQALDTVAASLSGSSFQQRSPIRRLTPHAMLPVIAVLVVAASFGGLWFARRSSAGSRVNPNVIAVLPFRVTSTDANVRALREGMLDLFAAKLTGTMRTADTRTVLAAWRRAGGSETVDVEDATALSAVRAIGAGRLLEGEILQTGPTLQIHGTLIDVNAPQHRASATVSGAPAAIAALVDSLTAKLLVLAAGEAEQSAATLASIPLPALQAYLVGQRAYRRGLYRAAIDAFAGAIQSDSTFALAGLQLRSAASWLQDERGALGAATARRYADRLSPVQRLILGPPPGSDCADVHEFNENAVQTAPDVAELWYELGDNLFHCGLAMGMQDAWARALAAFQRALAIDSSFTPALEHVPMIQAFSGDSVAASRTLARFADTSDYLPFNELFILSDRATRMSVVKVLERQGVALVALVAASMPLLDRHPDMIVAESLLARAARGAVTDADRQAVAAARYEISLDRGQPERAQSFVDAMQPDPADLVLAAIFCDADSVVAMRALPSVRKSLEIRVPAIARDQDSWVTAVFTAAEYDLAHRDTSTVRRAVALLRSVPRSSAVQASRGQRFALVLDAQFRVLSKAPAAAAAVSAVDSMLQRVGGGRYNEGIGNLIAAGLWEQLGDSRRAFAATQRLRMGPGFYPFGSTFIREGARLAAASGDADAAIQLYRRYIAIRDDPEPSMRSDVEAARHELARLEKQSSGK